MSLEHAKEILKKLEDNHFEAYIVGGSVRDLLLNVPVHDFDIATSATPEEVIEIFPKTIPVGIEHGTVIIRWKGESYETTTFRAEGKYEDNRRPSNVQFITSIREDLSRRDFTINAMASDRQEQFIDPFGGKEDLKKKRLRTVGDPYERFEEDPLRITRGARFVSKLSLDLEEETYHAMKELAEKLQLISIERILVEFEKLIDGPNVQEGLTILIETNIVPHLPLQPYERNVKNLLDYPICKLDDVKEKWATVCYVLEVDNPQAFLKQWKLPNKKIKQILTLVGLVDHKKIDTIVNVYFYGIDVVKAVGRLQSVLKLNEFDENELLQINAALPIHSRKELAISGKQILGWVNRKPGPWVEELLRKIELKVIHGQLQNEEQEIKEWVKQWKTKLESN